jgi:hypothetical protein
MRHMIWRIKRWHLQNLVYEASKMSRTHWNIAKNDLADHMHKEPTK